MRAVKIFGWALATVVLIMLCTDLYHVLTDPTARHPLVTGTHAVFLIVGLVAVAMSSETVTNRIVKMVLAFRGKGGSDG